ncbi:MAG: hypothetical protein PF637_10580 [Spirochaetes bacterium]|jgi:predicted RNA-binding protein YlxR (DUF448 family)|nr:hypothetical protein [Spirochaetota bacterium]
MDRVLKKHFMNLLVYSSLNTQQLNHLGEQCNSTFDLYRESGFGTTIPVPRQSAATVVVNFFTTEEEIVELFTILLKNEGKRFYNSELRLNGHEDFIKFLAKRKWIYDEQMVQFFRDPFFENEINILKQIRVIDLRNQDSLEGLMQKIEDITATLGDKDLEWSVNLRLYDLDREISMLIRKIIDMLLVRQNLQSITFDLFTCLKELAINASKANYKLLFEKLITAPEGIDSNRSYALFLRRFKEEIAENGNSNLLKMAKKKDRYINITFQSNNKGIGVWVTNNQNITALEKKAILQKLGYNSTEDLFAYADTENNEGAGLGIKLVLSILRIYTDEKIPLKVVFYPKFIKMGFFLDRNQIASHITERKTEQVSDPPGAS